MTPDNSGVFLFKEGIIKFQIAHYEVNVNGLIVGQGKYFKAGKRHVVSILDNVGVPGMADRGFFVVWKKARWQKGSGRKGVAYILVEGHGRVTPAPCVRYYSANHLDLQYYRIIRDRGKVKYWYIEELIEEPIKPVPDPEDEE